MKKKAVIFLLSLVIVSPILAGDTTEMLLDPLQYDPAQDTVSFKPTFGFFLLGYCATGVMGLLMPVFIIGGLGAEPSRGVAIGSAVGGAVLGSGTIFYIAAISKRRKSALLGTGIGSALGILMAVGIVGLAASF